MCTFNEIVNYSNQNGSQYDSNQLSKQLGKHSISNGYAHFTCVELYHDQLNSV